LIRLHSGRERLGGGLILIVLLPRDQLSLEQLLVALGLDLRVLGLGHVAGQRRLRLAHARQVTLERRPCLLYLHAVLGEIGLGLGQRGLGRAWIDREQQVALLDVL